MTHLKYWHAPPYLTKFTFRYPGKQAEEASIAQLRQCLSEERFMPCECSMAIGTLPMFVFICVRCDTQGASRGYLLAGTKKLCVFQQKI